MYFDPGFKMWKTLNSIAFSNRITVCRWSYRKLSSLIYYYALSRVPKMFPR